MGLTRWTSSWRSAFCRRFIASKRNVEGGLHRVVFGWLSFVVFFPLSLLDGWVDGLGRCPWVIVGMRVSLRLLPIYFLDQANLAQVLWNMLRGSKPSRLLPS